MNNHFEARKAYLRNVLISIGICLYFYIFQTDLGCRLCGDEEIASAVWPICMLALYGILAWIRGKVSKEWTYTGTLNVIPKMFIVYMIVSVILNAGELVIW